MNGPDELNDFANFTFARRGLKELSKADDCVYGDYREFDVAPDDPDRKSEPLDLRAWLATSSPHLEHQHHPAIVARKASVNPTAREAALEERVRVLEETVVGLLAKRQDVPIVDTVKSAVRSGARNIKGVAAAYVRPDGFEFIVAGPEWTEELSAAGAELAIKVQDLVAPTGIPYIEGSFVDLDEQPIGEWIQVYP